MTLEPGTRLGPYEIVAMLGAGGMGEVYRAVDTRLGRTVAIKIMSDEWRARPDLRARFTVEAEAIAALSHPHICQLFDVGREGEIDFLVMEYVEGETLAERLARGPIGLKQSLEYAAAMADALGAAHRRRIVHRDVKPANVILAKGGLKLLDFGLARFTARSAAAVATTSTVPAAERLLTHPGVALGTWQYMAPEQIRGEQADARSDVFALGAVMYEMFAGRRAFAAVTHQDLVNAILTGDPPELRSVAPDVPPPVAGIVHTCLAKDPDDRWQDCRDLGRALDALGDAQRTPAAATTAKNARRRAFAASIAAFVALAALTLAAFAWSRRGIEPAPVDRSVTRVTVPLSGADAYLGSLAISADGRNLVYRVGRNVPGANQLTLRPMDRLEATPLDGTTNGFDPFFSPDGRWLAFAANRGLYKINLGGGGPIELCRIGASTVGGTWGPERTIVFAREGGPGLMRVSEDGGTPESLTQPGQGERAHRDPQFLPDGRAVLFTVTTAETTSYDAARIEVLELATGARRLVLPGARWARYVASGHLVFARRGELYAAAFDGRTRQLTGDPVPIAAKVSMNGFEVHAAASDAGSIAYVHTGQPPESSRRLMWVTRQGKVQPVRDEPGFYLFPRISPDGSRVSLAMQSPNNTIWVHDSSRGTFTRVPSQGDVISPVWMPDGRAVVYNASWERGNDTLTVTGIDGTGERRLWQSSDPLDPNVVSADGRFAITGRITADTRSDLWVVPLTGGDKPWPLLQLKGEEYDAKLSPDGKWFAYVSNEAGPGRHEAYVRPFPGPGGRHQISTNGASAVVWSPSGREIFYRERDRIMAATVRPGSTFEAGPPKPLFTLAGRYRDEFDVSPDGQRFIMVQLSEPQPVTAINMIFDWVEDLKRRGAGR